MKLDFTGKKVLVTGATRGVGEAIADDFYALGADLILTGTDKKRIDELNAKKEDRKKYYCVDFRNAESTNNFMAELEKYNKIDICVNNAGINRIDLIEETKPEDWDDMVAVNLKGPYLVTREVARIMKENKQGRIINISSIFGVVSKAKRTIYSTTKFGLRGLTKAVSNEVAKYGVLVNSVAPGIVLTDMTKNILSEQEREELVLQVPAGRMAEPGEISKVVLFLASDLNTYITGKNIVVDGGFTDV